MKLLVWGTGIAADRFMSTVKQDVIGFVSKDEPTEDFYKKYFSGGGRSRYLAEQIDETQYDYLIVATGYSDEVNKECKKYKLDFNKIIFLHNNMNYNSEIKNLENLENKIFDKDAYYTMFRDTKEERIVIHKMHNDDKQNVKIDNQMDYVRFKTFELVANEIISNGICGQVAEAGVFRGDFATIINEKFSERKLYLFDTFEGFSSEELINDIGKGYVTQSFADSFSNTSVNLVLSKMRYPGQCVIKKGYFPKTVEGFEEKFAFVSLDLDIEEPIYNGLEYFYPRLEQGGYIFIHDYNSKLQGVKKAIKKYEDIHGKLVKVPICDTNGTVIIAK